MKEEEYRQVFENLCKKVKWPCWRSTRDEDIKQHFDCTIKAPKNITDGEIEDVRIELKGDKYASGRKDDPKYLRQYIEYRNVNGDIGWLFGEADYIAFLNEKMNGFYFMRPEAIIRYSENLFGVKMKDRRWEDIISDLDAMKETKPDYWTYGSPKIHKLYSRNQYFNKITGKRQNDLVTQITFEEAKNLSFCELKYFEATTNPN